MREDLHSHSSSGIIIESSFLGKEENRASDRLTPASPVFVSYCLSAWRIFHTERAVVLRGTPVWISSGGRLCFSGGDDLPSARVALQNAKGNRNAVYLLWDLFSQCILIIVMEYFLIYMLSSLCPLSCRCSCTANVFSYLRAVCDEACGIYCSVQPLKCINVSCLLFIKDIS